MAKDRDRWPECRWTDGQMGRADRRTRSCPAPAEPAGGCPYLECTLLGWLLLLQAGLLLLLAVRLEEEILT